MAVACPDGQHNYYSDVDGAPCIHCGDIRVTECKRLTSGWSFQGLDLASTDRTLIERKAITGEGPDGPVYDRGRGELSLRDKARLGFVYWRSLRDPLRGV